MATNDGFFNRIVVLNSNFCKFSRVPFTGDLQEGLLLLYLGFTLSLTRKDCSAKVEQPLKCPFCGIREIQKNCFSPQGWQYQYPGPMDFFQLQGLQPHHWDPTARGPPGCILGVFERVLVPSCSQRKKKNSEETS